jgi:hypothetical protein
MLKPCLTLFMPLTSLLSSVIVLLYIRISSAVAAVVRLSPALSPNACLTSEEKEL